MKRVIHVINVPRHMCRLVLGHQHKPIHRMGAGIVVMTIGVAVAKAAPAVGILHYGMDIAGYFIHAVGGVPFLDWLIESADKEDKDKE